MGFAQQPKTIAHRQLLQPCGRNAQLFGPMWLSHVMVTVKETVQLGQPSQVASW